MSGKSSLKKNNNGSTLIMVVICIAFISIVCSLLLSLTVCNMQMKSVNYKAQSNFYEAEEILDRMRMGIGDVVAEAVTEAYDEAMREYINTAENVEELFKEKYYDKLSGEFTDTAAAEAILKTYCTDKEIQVSGIDDRESEKTITLTNVTVNYTNSDHYRTTLSTDIVIRPPGMELDVQSKYPQAFSAYSLIADKQIRLDNATGVTVNGNVYAGDNGIMLKNKSGLTLANADNIITRGNIGVENGGSLTVKGDQRTTVWAENIETIKGTGGAADEAQITVEGDDSSGGKVTCYIADDLMINASNSIVTINGEYCGYGCGDTAAQGSSSIIINGRNSELDLSGTSMLSIAGRAYIATEAAEIPTGESLAIKSNQYAYLVPDECIWSGTNPAILSDSLPPADDKRVDLSKAEGIDISKYTTKYKEVFYNEGPSGGPKLVYYYLLFPTEEAADRYLEDYYTANSEKFDDWNRYSGDTEYAKDIRLKGSGSTILSAGNIFTAAGGKLLLKPDTAATPELLKNKASDLERRYLAMRTTLTEMPPDSSDASPFSRIVNSVKIAETFPGGEGVRAINAGSGNTVYIIHNAGGRTCQVSDLPGGGTQGMIIADGSVYVDQDFTGLILSGDTVTMKAGVTATASGSVVESIIAANNPDIYQYLNNYTDPAEAAESFRGEGGTLDISKCIVYKNWTKNEE